MQLEGRYLLNVSMDVDPDKEDIFNEVYDAEHAPLLMGVPGVLSVARFKAEEEVTLILGGERRRVVAGSEPRYSALYELDSPEALVSDAWSDAVDRGRWPDEVRPYTKNRRVALHRLVSTPS